jgi:acetate kinase
VISTDVSPATVRVIPTDEDLMIARSVYRILETGAGNAKD